MPLESVNCRDFRCLAEARLTLGERFNLITGPNGAGKTSILEAIAYLGRGRSFRGASTAELVREGTSGFAVHGKVRLQNRRVSVGVGNGADGLEVRVDGERGGSIAELADVLPLQIIEPDVHGLVAGGPEGRRRYLDWIAFHVEPAYLDTWRQFRRALRQRNAGLREAGSGLAAWDRELAALGGTVDEARQRMVGVVGPALGQYGELLLGCSVGVRYRRGWSEEQRLIEALERGRERDRQLGSTLAGPQRADLSLHYDERKARKRVSRGQQKLLASAMVLAATAVVQETLGRQLLVLLDDPAAELDRASLERLMGSVEDLGSQVIATALTSDPALFSQQPVLFHVEHGTVSPAGSDN